MPIEVTKSPLTPSADHSVKTSLTFTTPNSTNSAGEKWYININNTHDTNYSFEKIDTTIYDVRGQEHLTNVDTTGFQAFTSPSSVPSSLLLSGDDAEIARVYYPEVEALIKKQTGASRVVFFDHTVRKPRKTGNDGVTDPTNRTPVQQTHVDQTPQSAHKRVDRHVVPPVPYKRFQLINVWRPIENIVYDYPLAVCDFNSVDVLNDLEPTTLIYPSPNPNGETYAVKHNKNQVWWYWSEMTPSDVIMLKCYDSASRELTRITRSGADVNKDEIRDVAGLTPHTAFFHAEGAKKDIPRKSIEVRALVFYD